MLFRSRPSPSEAPPCPCPYPLVRAACDYLSRIGMDRVHEYEKKLSASLYAKMSRVPLVRLYGPPPSEGRAALAAFSVEGLHATDVSTLMDQSGFAIRSGHHCTQPLHRHLKVRGGRRGGWAMATGPYGLRNASSAGHCLWV